jgi:hypothetical protein
MHPLATRYALPYAVQLIGAPFGDTSDVVLRVFPQPEVALADLAAEVDPLVTAFFMLASTGALAGSDLDPASSEIRDHSGPVAGHDHLQWVLQEPKVSRQALVNLVDFLQLAHEQTPIARVQLAVFTAGATTQRLLAHDPRIDPCYPGLSSRLGYPLHIDPDAGDSPTLELHFEREPTPAESERVEGLLLTWAAATAMGLYPVAPLSPSACGIEPDHEVEIAVDEVAWGIHHFRAHTEALYGLGNVLSRIHSLHCRIREAYIE